MTSRARGIALGVALAVSWAIGVAAQTPDAVERDAQEYTRLVLRHDEILFREGLGPITAAERDEMPRLAAQGAAIQKKYAPGGAMSAHAAAYQTRVAALSATVVANARRRWAIEARTRAATKRHSGTGTYWTAMVTACLVALAVPLFVLIAGQRDRRHVVLSSDPAFQLPAALSRVRVFRKSYDVNFDAGVITGHRDYYSSRSPGGGERRGGGGTRMTAFSDGSSHEITDYSGRSDGGGRGLLPNRRAFHYKTPDGRETERHVDLFGRRRKRDPALFQAEAGAPVGFVSCGDDALLCVNHSTSQFAETKNVARLHRLRPIVMLCVCCAVAFVGLAFVTFEVLPRLETDNPLLSAAMVPWMLGMVALCLIDVMVVNALLDRIRGHQFRSKWKPAFDAFLTQHPPRSRSARPNRRST